MLNQDLISTLTSAAVAFGAAYCAVPHVDVNVSTTGTDLQGVGTRWSARMTLTDRVKTTDEASSPAYSREWSVEDQEDANIALQSLCDVVMRDFEGLADSVSKQMTAIGEACGILFPTLPQGVAPEKGKVVEMAADLTPAR